MKTQYQLFTGYLEKSVLITPLVEGLGGGRL